MILMTKRNKVTMRHVSPIQKCSCYEQGSLWHHRNQALSTHPRGCAKTTRPSAGSLGVTVYITTHSPSYDTDARTWRNTRSTLGLCFSQSQRSARNSNFTDPGSQVLPTQKSNLRCSLLGRFRSLRGVSCLFLPGEPGHHRAKPRES